jgi:hypothetical protein
MPHGPSERWRSGWDREFESAFLQRRVSNEPGVRAVFSKGASGAAGTEGRVAVVSIGARRRVRGGRLGA